MRVYVYRGEREREREGGSGLGDYRNGRLKNTKGQELEATLSCTKTFLNYMYNWLLDGSVCSMFFLFVSLSLLGQDLSFTHLHQGFCMQRVSALAGKSEHVPDFMHIWRIPGKE